MAKTMEDLERQCFEEINLTTISYADELPDAMDKEMYLKIFKKIYATIRHVMWTKIQALKTEKRLTINAKLKKDEFEKIYNDVHGKFEDYRKEIYELYMPGDITAEEARDIMQKCYITYSSLSSITAAKTDRAKEL